MPDHRGSRDRRKELAELVFRDRPEAFSNRLHGYARGEQASGNGARRGACNACNAEHLLRLKRLNRFKDREEAANLSASSLDCELNLQRLHLCCTSQGDDIQTQKGLATSNTRIPYRRASAGGIQRSICDRDYNSNWPGRRFVKKRSLGGESSDLPDFNQKSAV